MAFPFAILLGLIDPVARITEQIVKARALTLDAATQQEKIRSEERVKSLEARRDVLIAESGSRINSLVRLGFALPFLAYNGKLVVWDKILGLGSTDPLSEHLMMIEGLTLSFYFMHDIVRTWRGRA
jgi:hypothetical protein